MSTVPSTQRYSILSPVRTKDLETFHVVDPSTEETIGYVEEAPLTSMSDVLSAACIGQSQWQKHSQRERSNILLAAAEKLTERREEFARMITREMGKPLAESYGEVAFSADYLRWYSEEAVRSAGSYREAPAGGSRLLVTREPIGVSLLITPWNFPLAMGARKAAAALAAGCAVILKPAELTPITALLFGALMHEAGVPEHVFQVVPTTNSAEWSAGLMGDERLSKISFTGSTRVGSILIKQSAQHIQKLSLELGGDAPFIVFDDADLDRAVESAIVSKTRNGGQACVAANRFLIQEGISTEFVGEFSRRLSELKVGSGFDQQTQLGPMISHQSREKVMDLITDATTEGAQLHLPDVYHSGKGFFQSPQLLTNVSPESKLSCTEIFAPVAVVSTFQTVKEAVSLGNASAFGLAAYVFSQDIDKAFGVAHSLNTGVLGINKGLVADASSPFGGIAYSGYGKEGGPEGMQDFQVQRQFNLDAPHESWDL